MSSPHLMTKGPGTVVSGEIFRGNFTHHTSQSSAAEPGDLLCFSWEDCTCLPDDAAMGLLWPSKGEQKG